MSSMCSTSRSLSPTRSTMAWKFELRGDALLDAVDHRQLGVALLGFLEQPLRLVEEARVLERHAHAGGDGSQQPDVGLAERVLALVVLEHDAAEHAVAADDRNEHAGLAAVGARRHRRCRAPRLPRGVLTTQRLPPQTSRSLRDCPGWSASTAGSAARRARTRRGSGRRPPCRRTSGCRCRRVEDLAQLVADQVDDRPGSRACRRCPAGCC